MKKNIHPKYYKDVKVSCVTCNNSFTTGSTVEEITTEFCSKCHPFYTGEQRIVDTDNLVEKFKERQEKKAKSFRSKKQKMEERKKKLSRTTRGTGQGLTLKDMLAKVGK